MSAYIPDTNGASSSDLFTYDDLNRLVSYQRGTLNSGHTALVGSPNRGQTWNLVGQGNWDGSGGVSTNGTDQARTHNAQNQSDSSTSDANGNDLGVDGERHYDAWNCLTQVGDDHGEQYTYDALARRIRSDDFGEQAVFHEPDTIFSGAQTDLVYSNRWQVLEEDTSRHFERSDESDSGDDYASGTYVWSPFYVDELVLRDKETVDGFDFGARAGGDQGRGGSETNSGGGGPTIHYIPGIGSSLLDAPDGRVYVQQDANYNVTSLVDTSGDVVQRYDYDPYGSPNTIGASFDLPGTDAYAFTYLHQGGRWDANTGLYSFRFRDLDSIGGRWTENDPLGYFDGSNRYRALRCNPTLELDPLGLAPQLPYQKAELDPSGNAVSPPKGEKSSVTDPSGFGPSQQGSNSQQATDPNDPNWVPPNLPPPSTQPTPPTIQGSTTKPHPTPSTTQGSSTEPRKEPFDPSTIRISDVPPPLIPGTLPGHEYWEKGKWHIAPTWGP